ncbi:DNA-binding PadR family transcriptional regulator [Curtobacterium sp. PhB142]|uniref:PadR family transcriptional regulator n=1 Tax=unclassified Curtobacterium TaxID=257496 RepID=UPI0010D3A789|nr:MULTISPECIES: PadR family transcriptional regulator [unclassified Curtobacterium]TCL88826.1 DNA-binding PadR family transcriptional regulator [Curtobacterium sp. PhB142]TCM03810.1 DNA-binding PadR family transcriptional regulator [Curtobacterium sp. PhB134]
MSVRMGVLALLVGGPGYGYQLRGEFEHRTGGSWPLNIGQVYTTLDRLERDGLVARGDTDDDGHVVYTVTDAGRGEVARWFSEPVPAKRGRDELAIKFALAVTVPGVDVARLVQVQRGAAIRNLQDLTRLKRTTDPATDLAWSLVLESMVFQAEAEVRWLDHVESTVARYRPDDHPAADAGSSSPTAADTARSAR